MPLAIAMADSDRQINSGEHHKNIGLDSAEEDFHKVNWDSCRPAKVTGKRANYAKQNLTGIDYAKKTHRQCHDADKFAHYFYEPYKKVHRVPRFSSEIVLEMPDQTQFPKSVKLYQTNS